MRALKRLGVRICLNSHVTDIVSEENEVKGIIVNDKFVPGDSVIIATGGYSYPSTGSTGEGHVFAQKMGHTVTKCSPALVPFTVKEEWVKDLQGLSLKNCLVTITDEGKKLYEAFGELLFTHFGVSGPTVLSASSVVVDIIKKKELNLIMDLKPK